MKLINDSRFFEPHDVEEPEYDIDGDEVQRLTKEECRELLGEYKYETRMEK